ncbi:MAG: hypothetical protein P1S60_17980, partial [Anaerolineae bacterium]|nr:hypothetical protein [Anaerolineae bacterium]
SSVGVVNPEPGTSTEIRFMDADAGHYNKIILRDGVIIGSIVINNKVLARELENMIANRQHMNPEAARKLIS